MTGPCLNRRRFAGLAAFALLVPAAARADLLTRDGLGGREAYMARAKRLAASLADTTVEEGGMDRLRALAVTLRAALQDLRINEGARDGKVGPPPPVAPAGTDTAGPVITNPDPDPLPPEQRLADVPPAWFQLQTSLAIEAVDAAIAVMEEGGAVPQAERDAIRRRVDLINRPAGG